MFCGQTCDAAPQTTNCDLSESNASNVDTFQSPQNSVSSRTHLNRTILQSSRTDLEDEQLISSETGDRECIKLIMMRILKVNNNNNYYYNYETTTTTTTTTNNNNNNNINNN